MSFVQCPEFVAALDSIGIAIPRNSTKVVIIMGAGDPVRIECEMLVERFVDVTAIHDRTRNSLPTVEKVTKRYKLVEDDAQ